jgi:hypothetical protein
MYILERNIMSSKDLLGALYTGNKEKAKEAFDSIIKDKTSEALRVKKVAVTADVFNKEG